MPITVVKVTGERNICDKKLSVYVSPTVHVSKKLNRAKDSNCNAIATI